MDLAEIHQDHYFNKKLEKAQREKLRVKTEKIIEAVLNLKQAQAQLARQLGFDHSAESFIKGERNIVILYDIGSLGELQLLDKTKQQPDLFQLCMMFEMEPIKTEMFDCDQFIITVDDLIVQLVEALKYDKPEYEYEDF